jgi:hypothetical protein
MRTPIATMTLALALAAAPGGRAEAQVISGLGGGPTVFTGPGGPVALTPGVATFATAFGSPGYSGTGSYTPPYSYYAAIPPMPARIYVGYGDTGFPFYGRPYGLPNDRWSWAAMSDRDQGVLARYYYPPVR